jgi:atypical dual specificity phosphatase
LERRIKMRINTFIKDTCRRVLGLILGRPFRFSWVIDGQIAWSSQIYSHREIKWLRRQGIKAILSLTERPIPHDILRGYISSYMHEPMLDHAPLMINQTEKCVTFIRDNVIQQRPVLVHCSAGKGRSGAIIAAYLIKVNKYTPSKSMAVIRSIRPGSIEPTQEQSLMKYYEYLRGSGLS